MRKQADMREDIKDVERIALAPGVAVGRQVAAQGYNFGKRLLGGAPKAGAAGAFAPDPAHDIIYGDGSPAEKLKALAAIKMDAGTLQRHAGRINYLKQLAADHAAAKAANPPPKPDTSVKGTGMQDAAIQGAAGLAGAGAGAAGGYYLGQEMGWDKTGTALAGGGLGAVAAIMAARAGLGKSILPGMGAKAASAVKKEKV